MKNFLVVVSTFFMFSNVCADFSKIPLLESFTNVNCPYCARHNEMLFKWEQANKGQFAIVSYHILSFGDDPMYDFNKSMNNIRAQHSRDFFSRQSIPWLIFHNELTGSVDTTKLNQALATETAKKVPVKITPTISIDYGIADINVEIFSSEAMSGVRLQVLIIQDMIEYNTSPGSNGEKTFHYVARFALPSMNGENLTLNANETIHRNFTQELTSIVEPNKSFYVVAFLEKTNSEFVQAGISETVVAIKESTVANLQVSPNPTNHSATLTVDLVTAGNLTVTVNNLLGQELLEIHSGFTDAGTFTKTFSIETLPKGVYYLKIIHNGNVTVEKVVKK